MLSEGVGSEGVGGHEDVMVSEGIDLKTNLSINSVDLGTASLSCTIVILI